MKRINPLVALIFVTVFISGCATTGQPTKTWCVIAGAVAGGGAGALIEDDEEAVAGGAIAGGLLALLFCNPDKDEDGDGVSDSKDQCLGTPRGTEVSSNGCPVDHDGDGVPDTQDKCPDTPRGMRVNSEGCALDTDGDGVPNDKDRCPTTPKGAKVDARGCALDTDGDGVPDIFDQCADTPRGQAVNKKGCHIIFTLKGVSFALNSSMLTDPAKAELDGAVSMLKQNASVKVQVQGHTDSTGEESYNQMLSQKRAQSVVDYLAKNGIDRSRMTPKGFGESAPIASNKTTAGRASNRRVEFVIAK